MPLTSTPRRHRHNLRTRKSLAYQPAPTPPPPPVLFHVTNVVAFDSAWANWFFDQWIDDPASPLAGLTIDGQAGTEWVRFGFPNGLRVRHGTVAEGMAWNSTQGAGGITTADGKVLGAGSGTVDGE